MNVASVESTLKLALRSWLESKGKKGGKRRGRVIVWGGIKPVKMKGMKVTAPKWQFSGKVEEKTAIIELAGPQGPIWLVRPELFNRDEPSGGHGGALTLPEFARAREAIGGAMTSVLSSKLDQVEVEYWECDEGTLQGGLLAMDLAAYRFKKVMGYQPDLQPGLKVKVDGRPLSDEVARPSIQLAQAMNFARQLTNLPPNILDPETFAKAMKDIFGAKPGCDVDVWGPEKLKKEKCRLILAVGCAAASAPQLVHIRYRPKVKSSIAPIAFVGKGVTFDSGGLNLKMEGGMRWMKKDMGGAAAVAGLAWWVATSRLPLPCDFYLALAENAVGSRSFRPGDVIRSRSGLQIEIHNTDAEGRLVLADAMNVALESKPRLLIDVATLTGAIKAGLGAQVAGLFGNDDVSIVQMADAAKAVGDWLWPMPLLRKYKTALKSHVADLVNSGEGFGGAITAALFLENFVRDVPWLHLDIYAWKDSPDGPYAETGASGQPIQALTRFLQLMAGDK